jgi:hypothetical protein
MRRQFSGAFFWPTTAGGARNSSFFLIFFAVFLLFFTVFCGCVDFSPLISPVPPEFEGWNPTNPTLADEIVPDLPENDEFPIFTLRAVPVFCCDPLEFEFSIESSEPSAVNGAFFAWEFSDGRKTTGRSIQHRFPWNGDYEVALTVQLAGGEVVRSFHSVTLAEDGSGRMNIHVRPKQDGTDFPPDLAPVGPVIPTPGGPLSVNAGADQTVGPGLPVTLLAEVGGIGATTSLAYQWVQLDGPPVMLSDPKRARTSFLSPPEHLAPVELTFQVQVVAGSQLVYDEVTVLVTAEPDGAGTASAPVVLAHRAGAVRGEPVELTLSGTDPTDEGLEFEIVTPPRNGHLGAVTGAGDFSATVVYTSAPDFVGNDVFTFKASGSGGVSAAAVFTVSVTDPASPIQLASGTYLVPVNRPVKLEFIAQARSAVPLRFEVVNRPRAGSLTAIQSTSPLTAHAVYTPATGFKGTDSFKLRATDGQSLAAEATFTLEVKPLLVPWIEVNNPTRPALDVVSEADGARPGMTQLDFALAGLETWGRVTDKAIISTTPGNARHLYPGLMARKPAHLRIIGGLKTYNLPGARKSDPQPFEFAHRPTWQQLADESREIVAVTGFNRVLFEQETALDKYHTGQATIDYSLIRDAFQPLRETGIEFWWYFPSVLDNTALFPARWAHTTIFVRTVATHSPSSIFAGGSTGWYHWKNNRRLEVDRRDFMAGLVGQSSTRDSFFVRPEGYMYSEGVQVRCYTPTEAVAELNTLTVVGTRDVGVGEVMIYPGATGWLKTAEGFVSILPPLADTSVAD